MYIVQLLFSVLQCSYQLGMCFSQDIPTSRYSKTSRDIPGETKRRRQESFQLKPPPADWPSPTLGPADFFYDPPGVPSISPLQAYQHKLQEEYLKDLEEQSHKRPVQKQKQQDRDEKSVWSSSDEDFKKLLDPNELLKLNKKLAPILNKENKIASRLKASLINTSTVRPRTVQTHILPSKRSSAETTHVHLRKHDDEVSDNLKTSLEQKKTKLKKRVKRKKTTETKTGDKLKSRKKKTKAKRFSFDIHRSGESSSEASRKNDISKLKGESISKRVMKQSSSSSESSISSDEEIESSIPNRAYSFTKEPTTISGFRPTSTDNYTKTTPTLQQQQTKKPTTTKMPDTSTIIHVTRTTPTLQQLQTNKSTTTEKIATSSYIHVSTTTPTLQQQQTNNSTTTKMPDTYTNIHVTRTTPKLQQQQTTKSTTTDMPDTSTNINVSNISEKERKTPSTVSARKMDVREKRRQIKAEMEKVLKEEQLDSSFGDRDSEWTTSEEEFYIEYNDIRKSADRKIQALKKVRTTESPTTPIKFPIHNVTPRQALLGILKNKVLRFLDNIVRSPPNHATIKRFKQR